MPKDRFLAASSHELRTPLAPVRLALHMIAREKKLPASVRDALEMIRRNVDTGVRLIGDLLTGTAKRGSNVRLGL